MGSGIRGLIAVWVLLMVLLGLTAGSVLLPLGSLGLVVNFTLAMAKAGLIAWVYMRLRSESGLGRLMAGGVLAWVFILVALLALDLASRGWVV